MFELFFRLWKWVKGPIWGESRQNEMARLRALQMRGKGKKKQAFKKRDYRKPHSHRIRKR